ncbi:MAG: hypothetical protein ACI9M9_000790 [Flavobacteriaceae bacterium]|jgi:hypothetical protein
MLFFYYEEINALDVSGAEVKVAAERDLTVARRNS